MSHTGGVSPAQGREPSSHAGDISPTRRHFSLFDAVAGRAVPPGIGSTSLSAAGFPEEVLFRRKDAPDRPTTDDFYWAQRHLPPSARLPDSDLLKAVHAYAADYYARTLPDEGEIDAYTMNETALMAIGILLEETIAQILGETGDMALVEGESVASEERHENVHSSEPSGQSQERVRKSPPHNAEAHERTKHKRRRLGGAMEHAEAPGLQRLD